MQITADVSLIMYGSGGIIGFVSDILSVCVAPQVAP